ncbi:MAG: hypothetical protein M1818_006925 [Claussenomyces sp. TS43310]|nr:MAG: hypothetical protein M1818_006925 [Claussenomyces sp. TS43310]
MKFNMGGVWLLASAMMAVADDTLLPFIFEPLPLGSIKANGWLANELSAMKDGLAGNEFNFYQFVKGSSWMGQDNEYSSLNEGFPYWFNGIVPLAYGLGDDGLKAQVDQAVTHVLANQSSDGWIGPETTDATRNFWGRTPFFLGLTQLVEANATAYEPTVIPALHSFVILMNSMLANNFTGYIHHDGDEFDPIWGQARSHDLIITLQWLYEHYPGNVTQELLENMQYLNEKALDWSYWFQEGVFITEDLDTVPNLDVDPSGYVHGVNAGQGLKAGAVIRRFTHNDTLLTTTRNGVNWTFEYHGAASGTILADERLSGLSPARGSELCTAVEVMYSLSYLYQTLGDNDFADKCELAAYNALPVMVLPDWWSHQYMAEPNQGYPKFLSASFVTVDNGTNLGHALLAPATVSTTLGSGNQVTVDCETQYPFESVLTYSIQATQNFTFYVRVPSWYNPATSSLNGQQLSPDTNTGMHKVAVSAGNSTLTYTLGASINVVPRTNDTVAIRYGPLLYAVPIGQDITTSPPEDYGDNGPVSSQWTVPSALDHTINGTSAWQECIDVSTLQFVQNNVTTLPNPIFTTDGPPNYITVQSCEIPWGFDHGVPTPPPESRDCNGPSYQIKLVPYASAKLHMAELPTCSFS